MTDDKKTDDLAILYPDRDVTIAGEAHTVREFRYREGLEVALLARPFLAALRELFMAPDEEFTDVAFLALVEENPEVWLALVAKACGRDVEWVANLPNAEAMKLQSTFWEVNAPFFMRRLMWGASFMAGAKARRSRSRKSSPNSSGPDSAPITTTSDDASPGASSNAITA
jgi:hypothetical protein